MGSVQKGYRVGCSHMYVYGCSISESVNSVSGGRVECIFECESEHGVYSDFSAFKCQLICALERDSIVISKSTTPGLDWNY
jgi:hypothetical protein